MLTGGMGGTGQAAQKAAEAQADKTMAEAGAAPQVNPAQGVPQATVDAEALREAVTRGMNAMSHPRVVSHAGSLSPVGRSVQRFVFQPSAHPTRPGQGRVTTR